MTKLEEITAQFLGERSNCRWGDTFVGQIRLANGSAVDGQRLAGLKGDSPEGELVSGIEYRFYGKWSEYHNKRTGSVEKQFQFQTFTQSEPHEREGIIAYLVQAGQGRGIGPARAAQIFDKWGSECVAKLREAPEEVAGKIRGLSAEDAQEASTWLKARQKLEACTISVTSLLAGRGFRKTTPRWAINNFGNLAADIVRRDPFKLIQAPGVGFKRCDALWSHLGLPANRLRRQAMCAWYSVSEDRDGSTWVPMDLAKEGVKKLIGGAQVKPDKAIEMCLRLGNVSPGRKGALSLIRSDMEGTTIQAEGGRKWVAVAGKALAEERLAELIVQGMAERAAAWPAAESLTGISGKDITDHQRAEYAKATSGGALAILGGGPGCGKTFTAAAVIKQLIQQVGIANIAVGAPTGKAAVRITEAMQAAGLQLRARTWHSILGIGEVDPETGDLGFAHNENSPLRFKVLVGDESSMVDVPLFCSVMRARPKGCLFLIVGDVNQLPPIGHGAPLRDMIAAGLPYGELTEIKRASGGIVETCAAIRQSKPWSAGGNLIMADDPTPAGQLRLMMDAIRSAESEGLDPIWDVQPVVAVNAKSPLSRKAVNELLQRELNPNAGDRPRGSPFSVGDKVVCLKNGYYNACAINLRDEDHAEVVENDRGEVFVANGELGEVLQVGEKSMMVKVRSPERIISIPRGKPSDQDSQGEGGDGVDSDKPSSTGCSWDLGFALSVHKGQGSEWPWVIVLIDEYPGARMICTREWNYTAISRAKLRCVLIGKKSVIDAGCRKVAIGKRKTFLRELILKKRAERMLSEL